MSRRWIIMLLGLPAYLFTLMVVGTMALGLTLAEDRWQLVQSDFTKVFAEPGWWIYSSISAAVVTGLQAAFLIPVFRFSVGRSERSKSIFVSAIMLAIMAALLTTGLVIGLAELFITTDDSSRSPEFGTQDWGPLLFWSMLIVSWLLWSIAIFRFARRSTRPEDRFSRIIGLLLGGTIVEVIVIVPIDIMVRRRTDCYCNTGTFFALAISIVGMILLAGPGIFIALTSKRRQTWYQLHCENCGYSKGPSPAAQCPECGHNWGGRASGT